MTGHWRRPLRLRPPRSRADRAGSREGAADREPRTATPTTPRPTRHPEVVRTQGQYARMASTGAALDLVWLRHRYPSPMDHTCQTSHTVSDATKTPRSPP